MKLLECKDKLTINELLQIAFEYGNDNSDMPADSESITESFNEWLKENDDLFKKLILPPVSNLMPELEKIVSSRIKDAFDNGMQNYEKNELQAALDTIKRLVPPSYFEGICC